VDTLLAPLEFVVSWIMIGWHALLAPVFGTDSGGGWALSIVGLVVVVRILMIPLFVRQIHSSRKMQLLQPQVREIQKKYEGDRERQQQALLALYRDTKTNPFASCLPILLQAPVFFALFRTLNSLGQDPPVGLGAFADRPELTESAANATLFGAPLFATFRDAPNTETQIVAAVLVVIMVATTFFSQRQLMRKNMPQAALEGPFAQQQKILLYLLPLMFLFSGYTFPIGVVLYWCVSNFWSMGQQYYVIRRMPAPGSQAEADYLRRTAAKESGKDQGKIRRKDKKDEDKDSDAPAEPGPDGAGGGTGGGGTATATKGGTAGPTGNGSGPAGSPRRQQPKRTSRSQRRAGQARKT
jgi:YidC/Oxa1 family membrane protein insertase